MGQRRPRAAGKLFLFILISCGAAFGGCGRADPAPPTPPARSPTLVSLVPAATDLIVAMGAADHLVGVSNYDDEPQVSSLRRCGDYLTTDWERIVELHPQIIITQYAPGRTPAGFVEHLQAIGAQQENFHIDRIDDIYSALTKLGEVCQEQKKAGDALLRLRAQLQGVRERTARIARTPALIVIDETGQNAVGPRTYLDDLLTMAGGKNVLDASSPSWPSIDRETLVKLAPQVILQLLPDASTQVKDEAIRNWQSLPNLPAVQNHRIIQLTDSSVQQPGYHVGDLAERFEQALHPTDKTPEPATSP